MAILDNFSVQAKAYAVFRPDYPEELVRLVVSLCNSRESALDVATGNGQLAVALSPYFSHVSATDISERQLANAIAANNVSYKKGQAEKTAFPDRTFDLITVAQAVHWFDFDAFYKESRRILKPDGIIAVLGYGLLKTNPEADAILKSFYHNILGPFWDPQRKYIDENYKTIPFPFDEINIPEFNHQLHWDTDQLLGYLETWSAVQHYKNRHNRNPVDLIREKLVKSWEAGDKCVVFPMLARIGKVKSQP